MTKKIELEYMEKVFNCDENNVTMQKKMHLKRENFGKIHFLFLGSKTDQRCSVRFTAPSHVCRDVHCGKIKTSVTRLCHQARNKPRESFLRGFPDTSQEVQL